MVKCLRFTGCLTLLSTLIRKSDIKLGCDLNINALFKRCYVLCFGALYA